MKEDKFCVNTLSLFSFPFLLTQTLSHPLSPPPLFLFPVSPSALPLSLFQPFTQVLRVLLLLALVGRHASPRQYRRGDGGGRRRSEQGMFTPLQPPENLGLRGALLRQFMTPYDHHEEHQRERKRELVFFLLTFRGSSRSLPSRIPIFILKYNTGDAPGTRCRQLYHRFSGGRGSLADGGERSF